MTAQKGSLSICPVRPVEKTGSDQFKVARNSFLARAAWAADCACSRERTRLTQVQI